MSLAGTSVSSRRSKCSKASSSLFVSHAQARAELAMANARAQFAKKKAVLMKTQAEVAADLNVLNANEEVAACKAKADILEAELNLLSDDDEASLVNSTHPILPQQSVKSDKLEMKAKSGDLAADKEVDNNASRNQPMEEIVGQPILPQNKDNFTDRVNMWKITPPQSSSFNETGVKEIVKHLQRPKHEVKKFGGNPLEFRKFIRQFRSMIVVNTDTDEERISYLEELTTGEANKVVSGCSHLNAERAYQAAMCQLEERYGNNEVIANAYIKRALDWSSIKPGDARSLDEFGLLLTECMNAAESIDATKVLEYPDNIRKLMEKLPIYLHDKWRSTVHKIRESKKSVKFEEFVKFVRTEAKKINDPIFGRKDGKSANNVVSGLGDSSKKERITRQKGSSYTVNANSNGTYTTTVNLKCILCAGPHWLSRCNQFKSMSVKDRKNVVRDKGLCRNCLNTGHFVASCPKNSFCKICTEKHSSFLHPNEANVTTTSNAHVSETQPTSMAVEKRRGKIGLAVIAVEVRCPGRKKSVTTYALLDNGSNTTFCTNNLATKLGARGERVNLDLMSINGPSNERCNVISLEISGVNAYNDKSVVVPNVYTKSSLPISTNVIATQEDVRQWRHLEGIEISNIDSDIELLIGADVPAILQPIEVRTPDNGGPYATRTMFGWVVNGPLNSNHQPNYCNFISMQDVNLNEQFKSFCNMEFSDLDSDQQELSQNDIQALKIMEESIILKNGHYQVSMPWKTTPSSLPNNYTMAHHRLKSLKSRLEKSEETHTKYTEFMQDLVDNGHARKVSETSKTSPKWYLPHHPVLHPQKPGKVRVVFDCSAKFNGVCLNDKLYQGPDLTNSLVGVLLRFRCSPIAFCADIKKMFYQVNVTESDANFLRYLWWENGDFTKPAQEYQMLVHLFGGRSSPSCANFALKRTVQDHGKFYDPIVSEVVNSNFYVDDLLKSAENQEEAIKIATQVKQLLACGGFHLTKWISNSSKLVSTLSDAGDASMVSLCNGDQQRALGIRWLVGEDSLGYTISPRNKPTTRRGILSVVSSVFDPLGLAAPFILKAKLLLQELCRLGYDWDTVVSAENEAKWQQWLSELENLKEFRIQRCYKSVKMGKIIHRVLHNFGDASSTGYGAASYLCQKDENGRMECTLVAAKSRLAPIKAQTIPRLELQAALLTARLNKMVKQELKELQIDESVCWTDSTCVLRYLHNENSRFKTYVGNRVSAILSRTSVEQWRFVNSELNPADLASRGLTAEEMMLSDMWLCGPVFLKEDKSKWPQMPDDLTIRINDQEVKAATYVTETKDKHLDTLMMRYSSWLLLTKVTAWILRYKSNLKKRVIEGTMPRVKWKKIHNNIQPLTVQELKDAEKIVLMYIQQSCFPDELTALKNGTALKLTSSLVKLDPILVKGIMNVGGRLGRSSLDKEAMHQIILPKSHHVTTLILRHYHHISGHSGVEGTMAEVRQRFWPINGRASLKSIIRKCVKCRKISASTLQQKMADLPPDRVQASLPPFTNVGIDCFGPFYVKQGRARVKRYGIIFTCLNIRAVHLEVSNSLDTESFINALRRFIARRGAPKLIRSDNGGNFVRGNKELRESIKGWNQEQIHGHLLQRQIEWRFNPPTASHHGGAWERCIRTVRKVLAALTREQVLKDEGLRTLFCEVENIVNNRPITQVSDDPKDEQPLTPNHLLLLRSGSCLAPATFDHGDNYSTRRWRQIQYLADVFWRRWIKEYLPSLQERRKWCRNQPNLKVGDVVIVFDDNTPRSFWPLARVIEVYTNHMDGLVRSVKVKTQTGTLIRPITKLISLEITDEH